MSFDAKEQNEETPDIAISMRGISKSYEVYDRPQDRLKQILWPGRRKFYREFVAVRNVDLEIKRGECVGVVGRNGSGKSTLLKLICGTVEPSSGELLVRGSIAPMLTLGVGFSPEFTGRENATLNATILGLSKSEVDERMESIISFADIGEFFDQPVKSYSSGMYSRLAFSVAISAQPDILVIDEVLAVGDDAFMRKCFARIEQIKRDGATILFVSHAPNLVIELCDRAVLMEQGMRLLTSDPKTVTSRYHKLLYGDPVKRGDVIEELHALDRGLIPIESATNVEEEEDRGDYDPTLKPESTVHYERKGAVIRNARINDSRGERVNVLRPGLSYVYSYDVEFVETASMVRFGMLIKLVSGFEFAGQASHPEGDAIEYIEAGTRAHVSFCFVARLVPGTYFLNAGVLGRGSGEESYLHRILDVTMFRVSPSENSTVTGLADLTTPDAASVRLVPPEIRKQQSA